MELFLIFSLCKTKVKDDYWQLKCKQSFLLTTYFKQYCHISRYFVYLIQNPMFINANSNPKSEINMYQRHVLFQLKSVSQKIVLI